MPTIPGIDVLVQLPGEPRGKGRPNVFVLRGRIVQRPHPATFEYESLIRGAARNAMRGRAPFLGAIDLTIEAMFSVPDSWPKYRRREALAGVLPHTNKPDTDNIVKAALDAMNKIVWNDDSQVVRIIASKHYGPTPGLMVAVNALRVNAPTTTPMFRVSA